MTIGAIKFPKKIPNFAQALFSGVSKYGFNIVKTIKVKLIINAQILIASLFNKGHRAIIKKKIKKTIPKLLFELIFILSFCKIKLMKVVFSYPLFLYLPL